MRGLLVLSAFAAWAASACRHDWSSETADAGKPDAAGADAGGGDGEGGDAGNGDAGWPDGPSCEEGAARACGSSLGACAPGTQTCAGGAWGDCTGGVEPTDESCNSADDDCDGATDEGCGCTDGESRACGGDEGACVRGTQTCAGGAWGDCAGGVGPADETCNGADDDCDGATDEGSNPCGGACALADLPGTACDFDGPMDLDACNDDVRSCDGPNATRCTDVDTDADGDGYSAGVAACNGDCNDSNPALVTPESDAALCARLGKNCGGLTATDNCGMPRSVASCGTCPATELCGGGGTANVCGCRAEAPSVRCAAGMCRVGAGCFVMGCTTDSGECDPDELPAHAVAVPAFEIDQNEVTEAAFQACVAAGACRAPEPSDACDWHPGGPNGGFPVACIDWFQARAYCEWAGKRLCGEAEWEKAARGTDGRKFPWGNAPPTCALANFYAPPECGTALFLAGSNAAGASPYGARDMAGSLYEWVADAYHPSYEGAPADGSAWTEGAPDDRRIVRGGCFVNSEPRTLRSSYRVPSDPGRVIGAFGFRCCRTPP